MDDERRERFTSLYSWARPRVIAYSLRRTRSTEDAADVVAETFAIAWRRIEDVPQGEEALLWLYVTARHVLANEARRARRHTDLLARVAQAIEAEAPHVTPRDEDGFSALQCLRSLPEPDREVLMLSAWEGLGAPAIGQVLGCSPTAARIRLHRARRRLDDAMGAVDAGDIRSKRRGSPGHTGSGRAPIRCTPEEA